MGSLVIDADCFVCFAWFCLWIIVWLVFWVLYWLYAVMIALDFGLLFWVGLFALHLLFAIWFNCLSIACCVCVWLIWFECLRVYFMVVILVCIVCGFHVCFIIVFTSWCFCVCLLLLICVVGVLICWVSRLLCLRLLLTCVNIVCWICLVSDLLWVFCVFVDLLACYGCLFVGFVIVLFKLIAFGCMLCFLKDYLYLLIDVCLVAWLVFGWI